MRKGRLLVAGLLALLALGGCSTLPTQGEPHEFAIETPQRDPIRQFGSAPQPGSSPAALVEDFLRASAAGMYDDFATARLYLTPEASTTWRPDVQVAIFPSDFTPEPELRERLDHEVQVSLPLTTVGTVNELGILSASVIPGSVSRSFTLTLDADGEWRISALDDGVVLSQAAFNNAYQSVNLYFPSSDLTALVADPRWYPRTRLSSYLVKGLVDGPGESLGPAVTGDLAADLTLPTAGVEVVGGTATVNFEGASSPDERDRGALVWQVVQTLRQVPAIQTVSIRINGVELDDALMPSGPKYRLDRGVGLLEGAVVMAAGDTHIVSAQAAGAGAQHPTIGPLESSPIAWVDPEQNLLLVMNIAASSPRQVDIPSPTAPSVDRYGAVWVGGATSEGAVWVVPPGGDPVEVPLPFDGKLTRVAISPDGARLVALVQAQGGAQVVQATVVRGADDDSYTLESPVVLAQFSHAVKDLTWVGDTTVAGLAADEEADTGVEIYSIGGWPQLLGAPPEVTHITAAGLLGSLIVQRDDGTAFQRAGAAWVELDSEVEQLSFAG